MSKAKNTAKDASPLPTTEPEKRELTQEEKVIQLTSELQDVKTRFDNLVTFVNALVDKIDARVETIDKVAFAALLLHEGKEYIANPATISATRDHIEVITRATNDYIEQLKIAREKEVAKREKAEAKKAKVQEKRDARKGKKVAEDANKGTN